MPFERVTIVGPGLIGGSLGLALKAKKLVSHVVGVGRREASLRAAQAVGAVDSWTLDLAQGVKDADWVVLATRVGLVCELGIRAIPAMKSGAILSDVGSTKAEIVAMIEAHVCRGVGFVGMHPLAGSERRGVEAANAGLFAGSVCILTPTKHSNAGSLEAVSATWRAVGACVKVMSPAAHDAILAQISHLPHLAAACLLNAIDESALAYAAGGLRSATRIAGSDPELWLDIFRSNRRNLLDSVERLEKVLEDIRGVLSVGDDEALLAMLTRAQEKRQALEAPIAQTKKKEQTPRGKRK
jgi:prephenate dehydrogenase